ncbi:MAG: PorP/SprF family type IX secretion system membrane protein [Paludibacteraceae bacterium]|nr:PorP/SprF family type IX secretion system membrane protein [Paludibacteraceae bacterium]
MRQYINKIVCALFSILCSMNIFAQQDLMVSQQIFSRININPAGSGNQEGVDAFLLGRLQWAGVDNAPVTALMNVSYYNESLRSSFGLTTNYDNIGIGNSMTNVQAVYSYHVDLNEKMILSMGLSAGINVGVFDPGQNIIRDDEPDMTTYVEDKTSEVSPDMNFGLELTTKRFTFGLSSAHLLKTEPTTFKKGRHFYAYGRCLIPLSEMFDLAPMVSYIHQNKSNEMEIGAMLFISKKFWGGVTWKPDMNYFGDMSLMNVALGIDLGKFRAGYAYTFNVGEYNNLPSNTHELLLSVHF